MPSINYIIEGGIDFYSELLKDDDKDEVSNDNTLVNDATTISNEPELCLLTNEPLDITMVKLPCNHKFNYIPLYNEICSQKTVINSYETDALSNHEIKCPYCRKICDALLPPSSEHFGLKGVWITHKVNSISKNISLQCQYINKKTVENNNKDTNDNEHDKEINEVCKSHRVYVTNLGNYCGPHYHRLINFTDSSAILSKNEYEEYDKDYEEDDETRDNIQTINELFSIKNKVIKKNSKVSKKYSDFSDVQTREDLEDVFNHYLCKDELKQVLKLYNSIIKYGVKITYPKHKLIKIVLQEDLHMNLELWKGTKIYKYLCENKDKLIPYWSLKKLNDMSHHKDYDINNIGHDSDISFSELEKFEKNIDDDISYDSFDSAPDGEGGDYKTYIAEIKQKNIYRMEQRRIKQKISREQRAERIKEEKLAKLAKLGIQPGINKQSEWAEPAYDYVVPVILLYAYNNFFNLSVKHELELAICIYNSNHPKRIAVTGTKEELLKRIFKHGLHMIPELWDGTKMHTWLLENADYIECLHTISANVSEIVSESAQGVISTYNTILNEPILLYWNDADAVAVADAETELENNTCYDANSNDTEVANNWNDYIKNELDNEVNADKNSEDMSDD